MSEKRNRTQKASQTVDYYTVVIIGQFFICLLLSLLLYLLFQFGGGFGASLKERFNIILGEKGTESLSAMAEEVFSFFADSDVDLAVNGDTVTDAELYGMGGEDIELYEAAEKTSFAPFVTTDTVLNPIENGRYTSYFGYRTNPITGEWSFHTGLDIAASEGTNIRAALKGQVTKVGEDGRAGKYVFLTHSDGFQTFYCHCSEILVEEGMYINKGETVAKVGTTGWSTGPHLHFEFRRDGIRLNPLWALENDR